MAAQQMAQQPGHLPTIRISLSAQIDFQLLSALAELVILAVRHRPWGTKLLRCIATNACRPSHAPSVHPGLQCDSRFD